MSASLSSDAIGEVPDRKELAGQVQELVELMLERQAGGAGNFHQREQLAYLLTLLGAS